MLGQALNVGDGAPDARDEPHGCVVIAPVDAGPGLSVADAEVNESAGVPLRFRVTLDAPAQSAVSVRYRTADDSARAGADYVGVVSRFSSWDPHVI